MLKRFYNWVKDLKYPLGYRIFCCQLGWKRIFCHIFGCSIKLDDKTSLLRCNRCGIYGFIDNSPKLVKKEQSIQYKYTKLLQHCWKSIRLEYLERFNPDKLELTEEVIKMIEEARKDYVEGRFVTYEELFGKEKDNESTC